VADAAEVELAVADTRLLCIDDCCCVATVVPGTAAPSFCNKLGGTNDGVMTDDVAELDWGRLPLVTFVDGEGPPVVNMKADVETWEGNDEVICTSEVDKVEELGTEAGGESGTLLPATVVQGEVGGHWF
jgi:hypothetical protein